MFQSVAPLEHDLPERPSPLMEHCLFPEAKSERLASGKSGLEFLFREERVSHLDPREKPRRSWLFSKKRKDLRRLPGRSAKNHLYKRERTLGISS
jgi:hypothetical protein